MHLRASAGPNDGLGQASRGAEGQPSLLIQIFFLDCLDVHHKSPDSSERQCKSGNYQETCFVCRMVKCSLFEGW